MSKRRNKNIIFLILEILLYVFFIIFFIYYSYNFVKEIVQNVKLPVFH